MRAPSGDRLAPNRIENAAIRTAPSWSGPAYWRYDADTLLERPSVYFDRHLDLARLTDEQLSKALDEALVAEDSRQVWRLIDEIERRTGSVEV
jgi:hypothetical protein